MPKEIEILFSATAVDLGSNFKKANFFSIYFGTCTFLQKDKYYSRAASIKNQPTNLVSSYYNLTKALLYNETLSFPERSEDRFNCLRNRFVIAGISVSLGQHRSATNPGNESKKWGR